MTYRGDDAFGDRFPTQPIAILLALTVITAAVLGALAYRRLASSTPWAAPDAPTRSVPAGALGEADGAVPDGATVFDDDIPAVANLDPDLLGALRQAARDAAGDTSLHVSGDAIDIGHSDARAWLFEHGADYGLCRIYRNEPWHYELLPAAIDHGCPPMYADPTHDPRLQK